jgi:dipeptidyl aminopeptidase/acylaminoacyl peptidase
MRSVRPLILMLTLAACGGGGDDGDPPPPELGTLAYVETECRDTKEGFVERQALRIRQGEREPVTVFETPGVGPITGVAGGCRAVTEGRLGQGSITREAFQAVAVSPDGAGVVFDVSDEFSVDPPLPLNLPPEQKGVFWVRADGTGLRRLGPPSRSRFFDVLPTGGTAEGGGLHLNFSPDSRTIAFVDKAPDADGHESDQVVTIDVGTGTRTQVTHLPPAVPPAAYSVNAPTVWAPRFVDERTIRFFASANPDGLNPEGTYLLMTIQTDGSGLEVPVPITVALPGGTIDLRFVITGDRPQAVSVIVPGKPTNPLVTPEMWEIFVVDEGQNILQLTNFHRSDTWWALVDGDREHVYFTASADPLGTNPSGNCQLFSTDRLGSDLRQLTNFRESRRSFWGCAFSVRPAGCGVGPPWQDPRSQALLFYSSCDPFGTNPNGGQIFAMQPDGTGLRQLTDSRGLVWEADSTYSGELPGPWAYGPYVP